jgi:stage II sporulation protein D
MNSLAILALPFVAALPLRAPDAVRISLFSLFKPEMVQVRIASGDGALLDASGLGGNRILNRGEVIWIRSSGKQLNLEVGSSHGAIRQSVITDLARIVPEGRATLELVLPGKIKRTVYGALSVDAAAGERGALRILLTTDRESAVASVVAAETSRREPEALMALAVVVRTFMRSHAGRHSSEGFDYCDTTHCQFYRGEQDLVDRVASPAVANAVSRTSGQVLTFEGSAIEAYYTSSCGGLSVTPTMAWGGTTRYPYSRIACRWCRQSRFNKWERSADAAQILNALSSFTGSKLSTASELITDVDTATGFVQSVTVRDEGRRVLLNTDSFRRAIGQKLGWNTVLSPTFTVFRRGNKFIFRGRGFGSQVGLCEEGAIAQAAAGRGYREILSFYYPGTGISERVSYE